LEITLGAQLFDRTADGVIPTPFGESLLARASVIIGETVELKREIDAMLGLESGYLDVSMGHYPLEILGPEAGAALITGHPGLQLRLRSGDWREVTSRVLGRESELGIAEISEAATDDRLVVEPLSRHRIYLYCRSGHPLTGKKRIRFRDLLTYPWATSRVPKRIAGAFAGDDLRAGQTDPASGDFVPAVEVEVSLASRRLVANSDAIAGELLIQIERELEAGILALVPFQQDWMRLNYGFITLRGRTLSPVARQFMDEVRELDRQVAARELELRRRFAPEL
jgi:DNA-binding transcriptional LysR family regulator